MGQNLISIDWHSDLGLVTCRTSVLSFEDFKRFAKVLSARIGLIDFKLGQAKDGFFIWSTDSMVFKGILTAGITCVVLKKNPKLWSAIRKRGVEPSVFFELVAKILLYFTKNNPRPNMSLRKFKKRLQKSAEDIGPVCTYMDSILKKFIPQEELDRLKKKLIGGVVSFDESIHVLVEKIGYFPNRERVCLLCRATFIPEKGDWALYCPSCRRGPKKAVKMRISRHPEKDEIRRCLRELKEALSIDQQKEMISKLRKKFPEVFTNPQLRLRRAGGLT
jgi:hypothetical protein